MPRIKPVDAVAATGLVADQLAATGKMLGDSKHVHHRLNNLAGTEVDFPLVSLEEAA